MAPQVPDSHAHVSLPERSGIIVTLLSHIVNLSAAIIKTSFFEGATITVIVLNSIVLALEDPTAEVQDSFFILIDYIFLALYTLEMFLKIFGQGFLMN